MFPSWVCGRGVPRWFGSRRQYALCCWSRNVSVSACCSRPLSGSQAATVPSVAGWDDMPGSPVWWFRLFWFCGGHGPGETPGPIPNPVAKAWRGDGTAFERVWESSAPPHCTSVGVPVELGSGNPFLFVSRLFCPFASRLGHPDLGFWMSSMALVDGTDAPFALRRRGVSVSSTSCTSGIACCH